MKNEMRRGLLQRCTAALFGTLGLLAGMLVIPAEAQAATELPGGKANWVVSVGGLEIPENNNYRNWVRLGYYTFQAGGTVTTDFWTWNQRDSPLRVPAVTGANCGAPVPTCDIRTVDGFGSAASKGFRGTYSYAPQNRLVITWTKDKSGAALAEPLTESWVLEPTLLAGGGVARMRSSNYYAEQFDATVPGPVDAFSDYGATFGIGYGSNASLGTSSRVPIEQLLTTPEYRTEKYKGSFITANNGVVRREGTGGDWTFSGEGTGASNPSKPWQACAGEAECLGYLQPGTSCKPQGGNDSKNRVRYLAETGTGRQNTEEYWCESLLGSSGKTCYTHNSHPRPMLQVIDDAGRFQGWVGVEAFTHVDTREKEQKETAEWKGYYWGVFDMVSVSQLQPKLSAAGTVRAFQLAHGNSGVNDGTLNWGPRSVSFAGTNRAVSGCRKVEVTAMTPNGLSDRATTPKVCAGASSPFSGTVTIDVPGGPSRVQVTYLASDNGTEPTAPKYTMLCSRSGCAYTSYQEPTPNFRVQYGQSHALGELNWSERSATFSGNNHVASGCRYVELIASAPNGTSDRRTSSPLCVGMEADNTRPFAGSIGLSDVEGGAGHVDIRYLEPVTGAAPRVLDTATCTRNGCV
ncbi:MULTISPECIES: hypothetical protein [Streptomyces]|uniref:Uncharacterized protein n=1 Tax=Streptomyces fimbriatus TaxID=68197 RepID=A0ABW0DI06_STRFI